MRELSIIVPLVLSASVVFGEDGGALFRAIRSGDLATVKVHLSKAEIEARDARGATPLMHAAAFGNLETMKVLLDAGADVNARNTFDATALLWSARDPEKARLLIEHGADVNVQSKQGRTPLMVASLRRGGSDTVALLLAKGAKVNTQGGRGSTALIIASNAGEAKSVRLLLEKGADPGVTMGIGFTAMTLAGAGRSPETIRLLLEKQADVNISADGSPPPQRHGPTNRRNVTALHDAAAFGPVESVRELLKGGAKVDARDSRGLTPLAFALASETPSLETVRALIGAGADVNARDSNGETTLDWAEKFGCPEVLAELKKAGAKQRVAYVAPRHPESDPLKPVEAITRSLKLLEASSAEFFKESGCVGCHHQPLVARAQAAAKAAGIAIHEAAAKAQLAQMRGQWLSLQEEFLQSLNPGGGANRLAENLLGLKAAGLAADAIIDSAIVDVAECQEPDGSWAAGEVQLRPPLSQSDFAATARAVRAMSVYPIPARQPEFDRRLAAARAWFKKAKPVTNDDFSMRLSGLTWSAGSVGEIESAAKELLALQREDGGWGGLPYLGSDAYATGVALVALAESKAVRIEDQAYRRGLTYLLSTQFPDGSWHVRSRAIKFQPYFESNFPFGHDQWISAAATSWAVQAMALSLAP
jgi:ankyrin repeat protein